MRVLHIHCTKFKYETTQKTPVAQGSEKKGEFENVLVCFITFEKQDEGREMEIIEQFKENIKIDHGRIQFKQLLLYPYAHLSKNLGSPRKAVEFLKELGEELNGYNTSSSPFGWYKKFKLECKGHPLAEAYREY